MKIFYFDFDEDGRSTRDEDGHRVIDAGAAREEALQALAEVVLYSASVSDHRKVTCSVRSGEGRLVYRASLVVEGAWMAPDASSLAGSDLPSRQPLLER